MSIVSTAVKAAILAPVGWLVYSNYGIDHDVVLPDAFDTSGETRRRSMRTAAAGELSYYADESGEGRPVVLIHSVNAAANPREMQPLFDQFRGQRPVYAIDLPGFGFSERADRRYTPQLYADAIGEFLIHGVDQPPDVIALSLSCEFVALAASVNPDIVHSVTMVSPTGLSVDHSEPRGPSLTITPARTRLSLGLARLRHQAGPERVHRVIANPLWAQPLFDLIVSRPALGFFSPERDYDADYAYRTAHRPGAPVAPLYFLSRSLYTDDIVDTYRSLGVPTLVLHGNARYVNFDRLGEVLEANKRWHGVGFDGAGDMVHQDEPELALSALEEFWDTVATAGVTHREMRGVNSNSNTSV